MLALQAGRWWAERADADEEQDAVLGSGEEQVAETEREARTKRRKERAGEKSPKGAQKRQTTAS